MKVAVFACPERTKSLTTPIPPGMIGLASRNRASVPLMSSVTLLLSRVIPVRSRSLCGAIVKYSISCECGRPMLVAGTDAGTDQTCGCGRAVQVPPLHVLRRQADEPANTPELVIRVMLSSGTLPEGQECCGCGSRTDGSVVVRAECERVREKSLGSKDEAGVALVWFLLGPLFAWWAYRSSRDTREVGEDIIFDLPMRVCPDCSKGLRKSSLRRTMERVPVYAQLLAKYPRAKLELV